MKIIREGIQYFIQRAKCDCGGELNFTGQAYQSNGGPIIYLHQCNQCGKTENLETQYPQKIEVCTPCVEVSDFTVMEGE